MEGQSRVISRELIDELKRWPTADVLHLIFPDHDVRRRGVMSSPFRKDSNPSFSCFSGRNGYGYWKDHATGETGDNIDLYRKAFPSLGYAEAVDALSLLLLGRSAYGDSSLSAYIMPVKTAVPVYSPVRESAFKVLEVLPLDSPEVPLSYKEYWRSRGISDAVMVESGCRYVVYENSGAKGRDKIDASSGLTVYGDDGLPIKDDGIRTAIGLVNDIGGFSLREPDGEQHKGFKGNAVSSFISTVLAGGGRPAHTVFLDGVGDGIVRKPLYDAAVDSLWINDTQRFVGIKPWSASFALAFLHSRSSHRMEGRELLCVTAVFDSLNTPVTGDVVVVEGMFDGLSERELNRMRNRSVYGRDFIVANSINNLHWAVPFICRHRSAVFMLDNDLVSGAGQKAAARLCSDVAKFNAATNTLTAVFDGTVLFAGHKDLNEALMADKGLRPCVGVKPSDKGTDKGRHF